jgi:hypothetical protein
MKNIIKEFLIKLVAPDYYEIKKQNSILKSKIKENRWKEEIGNDIIFTNFQQNEQRN